MAPASARPYPTSEADFDRPEYDYPPAPRRSRPTREYDELDIDISRGPDSRRNPDFLREDYGRSSHAGPVVVRERDDRSRRRHDVDYEDEEIVIRRRDRDDRRSRPPPPRDDRDDIEVDIRRERSAGPSFARHRDDREEIDIDIRETSRAPRDQREHSRRDVYLRTDDSDRRPSRRGGGGDDIDIEIRESSRPPPKRRSSSVDRINIDIKRDERSRDPPRRRRDGDREEIDIKIREGDDEKRRPAPPRVEERTLVVREREHSRSRSARPVARQREDFYYRRRSPSPVAPPQREEIIIRKHRSPSPSPPPPERIEETIRIRRTRSSPTRSPSPPPAPSPPPVELEPEVAPITRPPIVQDIYTHHHHIDHERYRDRPAPLPALEAPPLPDLRGGRHGDWDERIYEREQFHGRHRALESSACVGSSGKYSALGVGEVQPCRAGAAAPPWASGMFVRDILRLHELRPVQSQVLLDFVGLAREDKKSAAHPAIWTLTPGSRFPSVSSRRRTARTLSSRRRKSPVSYRQPYRSYANAQFGPEPTYDREYRTVESQAPRFNATVEADYSRGNNHAEDITVDAHQSPKHKHDMGYYDEDERAHERQQIAEEGNDLGDDKGKHPQHGKNTSPRQPANNRVATHVAGAGEQVEEDEACGDASVQHAKEDHSRQHEAEADVLVGAVADGGKRRREHVVGAHVGVGDGAADGKDKDFGNGDGPQGLGEVARLLHLGDERGQRDLADEGVADVEEGAHAGDKGGRGRRDGPHLDGLALDVVGRVVLDAGEDGRQQDGDEGEDGGGGRQPRQHGEGARHGADPLHKGEDGGECNGAGAVLRDCVEILGADEAVEAHDEGVVQDEHDASEPPCRAPVEEQHLTEIAHVLDFGVAKTKLP
ncbi:hypothetical protein FH972_026564 [Carpinus fangiana]|uniref:Uncharacterized protein n=1 Tax=Carpinus fangiana TaxID=176857 RepID=A0A5N6L4C9_9ROSI|nr:hypothetical protein FH972_026564 [Carpinus fangiana]